MSEVAWASDAEKWFCIGFLSSSGVIKSIEANVPINKMKEFMDRYRDKFEGDAKPYPINSEQKYSWQLRMTLNQEALNVCPLGLYKLLDAKYQKRINNTAFIAELVEKYGFRFSNGEQSEGRISQEVMHIIPRTLFDEFRNGIREARNHYQFVDDLSSGIDKNSVVPVIRIHSSEKTSTQKEKKSGDALELSQDNKERAFEVGWRGEEYVYRLLSAKYQGLYDKMGIDIEHVDEIFWYNEGYTKSIQPHLWQDCSVGKGCDILVSTSMGSYYIEVKTSVSNAPVFQITRNELVKMKEKKDNFFLIHLSEFEKLRRNLSPEIDIYRNPFERFFQPECVHMATMFWGE